MADRPTAEELRAAMAKQAEAGKYDASDVDILKREVEAIRGVAIDLAEEHKTITCPVCATQYDVSIPTVHLTQVLEAPKTDVGGVITRG